MPNDVYVLRYVLFKGSTVYRVAMPDTARPAPTGHDGMSFSISVGADNQDERYKVSFGGTDHAIMDKVTRLRMASASLFGLLGSSARHTAPSHGDIESIRNKWATRVTDKRAVRKQLLQYLWNRHEEIPSEGASLFELMAVLDCSVEDLIGAIDNLLHKNWVFFNGRQPNPQKVDLSRPDMLCTHTVYLPQQMSPEVKEFLNESSQLAVNLDDHRYFRLVQTQTELEGKFAFVIMPFNEEEFPQDVFHDVYVPLVKEVLGIACVKVDNDKFKNIIQNKIYSHIVKSEFVIAELSTENPNVVFELGLAFASEKDMIPTYYRKMAKGDQRLAFDISNFDTIFYSDYDELRSGLREALEAIRLRINASE